MLRASVTGALNRALYNEFRVQWRSQDVTFGSANASPAVRVQGAFNAGGAQIDGGRRTQEFSMANDLDISLGRHAIRAGLLFDGGRYSTDVRRNTDGTFTFADLAAYEAGQPTTFTQNIGDPRVMVSQIQSALYVQDDFRASQSLTISGGIRQEDQSSIGGLHVGPRGGIAWSPFKSGKTTVRAGAGAFFDWFDAQTYEQTVQLDGTHQQIQTFVQPRYPDPSQGGHPILLPNGRVQLASDLTQPTLRQASVGLEQQLSSSVRLNATLIHRRGSNLLRGINVNAPRADGTRPDPMAGPITEIQSTGSSSYDALSINVNFLRPEQRISVAANYTLSRSIDETDSPLSVAANVYDLAAERGSSVTDARHRAMGFVNAPLFGGLTMGASFRVQSGLPYNITTGRDDDGDTISNESSMVVSDSGLPLTFAGRLRGGGIGPFREAGVDHAFVSHWPRSRLLGPLPLRLRFGAAPHRARLEVRARPEACRRGGVFGRTRSRATSM